MEEKSDLPKKKSVLVLYGSQTGNAADIATTLEPALARLLPGLRTSVQSMKEWIESGSIDALPAAADFLVVVVSTTGNGDPPDNAGKFYRKLRMKKDPPDWLSGLKFTVLGLGDTNYDQFCHMGKTFHKLLLKYGGQEFCESAFADEAVGLDLVVEPWRKSLFLKFVKEFPDACSEEGKTFVESLDSKSDEAPAPKVLILFGSQTGNAEDIAKGVSADLLRLKYKAEVMSMKAWIESHSIEELASNPILVLICSTTGNGDPPENAAKFFRKLKICKAPVPEGGSGGWLCFTNFCVLGLGDSNYDQFCNMGKLLQKAMLKAGSRCFLEPAYADEATGLESVVESWKLSLVSCLKDLHSRPLEAKIDPVPSDPVLTGDLRSAISMAAKSKIPESKVDERRDKVSSCVSDVKVESKEETKEVKVDTFRKARSSFMRSAPESFRTPTSVTAKDIPKWRPSRIGIKQTFSRESLNSTPRWKSGIQNTEAVLRGYTAEAPFLSKIQKAYYLTAPDSEKQVIGLELDLPFENRGMTYEVGDSIGVYCANPETEVDELMRRLALTCDPSEPLDCIWIQTFDVEGKGQDYLPHITSPCTLRDVFLYCVDIRALPSKALLRMLAEYCESDDEAEQLFFLSSKSKASRDAYAKEVFGTAMTLLDVLRRFPSCMPDLAHLLDQLPELVPRYYSAASSPAVYPGSIHLAVTVVQTPRAGLCSNWLYELCLVQKLLEPHPAIPTGAYYSSSFPGTWSRSTTSGASSSYGIPVFIRKTKDFTLPADESKSLIMIGPGTGVAPFRGFLQHRRARARALKTGGTSVGWWRGFECDLEESEDKDKDDEVYKEDVKDAVVPSCGAATLYFGCRNDSDFLYKDELLCFKADRTLQALEVAFSRKGEQKTYVQDLLVKNGYDVSCQIYEDGAIVYFCGDISSMAKDIQATFVKILVEHQELSEEDAKKYIMKMITEKRYIQDIWS